MPDPLPTIVVVGPPPSSVGGMATIMSQMCSMGLENRFRIEPFFTTQSSGPDERIHHRLARHLRTILRLRKVIHRTDAGIVHLHTSSGFSFFRTAIDAILAKRLGCRVILHIHGAAFDEFFRQSSFCKQALIARLLSHADRIVALSNGWKQKLLTMAPTARICVIENAIQLPPRPKPRNARSTCRFLLLARMDIWKGVDDALAACRRLADQGVRFELTLAGPEGTAGNRESLNRQIHERGLQGSVRYVGPILGATKEAVFAETDVYVQASHHEGLPLAMLEALSHGLPIVSTSVGAVPEFIRDQVEGLLVPARRPELLAEAMRTTAENPRRRDAMAASARRLAETRFALTRFETDLLKLYRWLRESPRADRGYTALTRPSLAYPNCAEMP